MKLNFDLHHPQLKIKTASNTKAVQMLPQPFLLLAYNAHTSFLLNFPDQSRDNCWLNFVFTFHSTAHQIFPEYLDLLQNLPQYLHLLSELPKLYPVIFSHQFNDQSNCWIHFPSHWTFHHKGSDSDVQSFQAFGHKSQLGIYVLYIIQSSHKERCRCWVEPSR